ncbi:AMP-binding protein [Azospirillum picis]|uniref:Crotonobetaine/carnitine-CoA ligase n=1 Tax=Azospirillum picis TaxID=488438 RepID=A0ABU0MNJ9_9PROT|nr:AMP-binding protein [Azospirillum picis]MBP2301785.1 crotonobetaine/carnitine-CoA ligase [Azospirillum picis]MDQ0535040.1 crotonobetaine/carnitine-CoA ligase [Azospirillum picis]
MSDFDTGFAGLLTQAARTDGDRLFARFNGIPLSVGALDRRSDAVAAELSRLGLRPGDRVALMLRNSPAVLPTLFGLAKAGLVWVPINAQQRGEGLRYILEHCDPRAILAEADLVPVIAGCGADMAGRPLVLHGAADGEAGREAGALRLEPMLESGARFEGALPGPDDDFAIMYTSGTTGRPKGALVTHRMMRLAGEAVARVADAGDGDVMFVWEPLYHIGGAQMIVLPLIRPVSLAMVDRFSASRFWDQVREYGATHIHYLGGILQILLKQPPSAHDHDHPVRIAWGGGCPKETWTPFEERFGVRIRECYGMTEASSITTCNDEGTVGAVGRPMPWFSVALLDEQGAPVPPGARGEIVVRSHVPGALFAGYFRNPEATGRALRDGALHTGDLGSLLPDGTLLFHGRMTDSMRCKGENVSAWEIEHIAATHPDVEDCAVIGVRAEVGEQDIKLFVKPKAGAAVDIPALSGWLAGQLAPYQNPRYIALVEEFERTPSQRIMKHRLPPEVDRCWDRQRG